MKNIKNYLIAILAGLLVLTLSTQSSNGAINSKPASISSSDLQAIARAMPFVDISELAQLAEYESCLKHKAFSEFSFAMNYCRQFKP